MGRRKGEPSGPTAVLPRIGRDRLNEIDTAPAPGGWDLETAAEAAWTYAREHPPTRWTTRAVAVAAFHAIAGSTAVDLLGDEMRERLRGRDAFTDEPGR